MNKRFKCQVEIFSKFRNGTRQLAPNLVHNTPINLGADHYFDVRIFFHEKPKFDQWLFADIVFLDQDNALKYLEPCKEYEVWESGAAGKVIFEDFG